MKMKRAIISSLLFSLCNQNQVHGQTYDWNYVKNGADWGQVGNDQGTAGYQDCVTGALAPIDLPTGIEQKPSETDQFQKHYRDIIKEGDTVGYFGFPAIKIDMPEFTNRKLYRNYFVSNYGQTDASTVVKYDLETIQLKAAAEHTIDGKRHDLEMQLHHQNKDQKRGMISVLFSVSEASEVSEDIVALIDDFFTSLKLTEADKAKWPVDEVPLGQLMAKLDTENRWSYTANYISPPCRPLTFYHVLETIYPIKEEHLGLLKAQIARLVKASQTGTWRAVAPKNGINNIQKFFKDRTPKEPEVLEDDYQVTLVSLLWTIVIIWLCIAFLAACWVLIRFIQKKRDENAAAQQPANKQFKGYQDELAEEKGEGDTGRQMA